MSKKKITALVITAVIVLAAIIIFSECFYVVQENEYVCVVRFSKIVNTATEAGIYVKAPFIDSTRVYPKHIMLYDISPSDVITQDKKSMTVDSYVLWQITDPLTFVKTIGSLGEAEGRLDVLTYNATKTMMGTLEQNDIINMDDPSGRNDIYSEIFANVRDSALEFGIKVIDVKIKRFDLPELNENAVYERMISERNQMAEKYIAEGALKAAMVTNEVDKEYNTIISNAKVEAEQIRAEGEAEYMRILAGAYEDAEKLEFYNFIRGLQALENSVTGDKTIILGKDSEFAKLLLGTGNTAETEPVNNPDING